MATAHKPLTTPNMIGYMVATVTAGFLLLLGTVIAFNVLTSHTKADDVTVTCQHTDRTTTAQIVIDNGADTTQAYNIRIGVLDDNGTRVGTTTLGLAVQGGDKVDRMEQITTVRTGSKCVVDSVT